MIITIKQPSANGVKSSVVLLLIYTAEIVKSVVILSCGPVGTKSGSGTGLRTAI